MLSTAGYDVLLFDYRGYGESSGRARTAPTATPAPHGGLYSTTNRVDESRIVYLGESLGAAVALPLALEAPPRGLVLESAFANVREVARVHYPFLPRALLPDAYPSLERIERLESPLLVLHGERDEIVPCSHDQALLGAAPGPKEMQVFPGLGHNDLIPSRPGPIVSCWDGLEGPERGSR